MINWDEIKARNSFSAPKGAGEKSAAVGSKKEKEQERKALVKNSMTENYNLSLPGGVGNLYARSHPEIAQRAVDETNRMLEQGGSSGIGRFGFRFLDFLNPAGSALNSLDRTVGEIDRSPMIKEIPEDWNASAGNILRTIGEQAGDPGNWGALLGTGIQYAMTGGLAAERAILQGTGKAAAKTAIGRGVSKAGRVAAANAAGGAPINTVMSLDAVSTLDDPTLGDFAKMMAMNTALDIGIGGTFEGASGIMRGRAAAKAAGAVEPEAALPNRNITRRTLARSESPAPQPLNATRRTLANRPNADFYVAPGGQVAKNIQAADIKLLSAPNGSRTTDYNVISYHDRAGVDKIGAKAKARKAITEAIGVKDKEGQDLVSQILKDIDTDVKDGWNTKAFWDGIISNIKKQEYETNNPETLYPGLKKELRNTPIKITDDLRQITDFNALRKSNMGKIKLSNNGRAIDELYMEWSDLHPDLFPASVTHPADRLETLIKAVDSLQTKKATVGDVMTDNEIWDGPLTDVWKAIDTYRRTVKESVSYSKAKGQREAPRTAAQAELAGASPRRLPQRSELPKRLPQRIEVASEPVGRSLHTRNGLPKRMAEPAVKTPENRGNVPPATEKATEIRSDVKGDTNERVQSTTQNRQANPETTRVIENLDNYARRNGHADEGGRNFEVSTHPAAKQIEAVASAFGAKVVFVRPLSDAVDTFHGMYIDGHIVINTNRSSNPAHVVFGHEVLHQIRANHPDEFNKFADVFVRNMSEQRYAKYKETFEAAVGKDKDTLMEEMMADFSGEMFTNPKIMERIFKTDRDVAGKLYDIVKSMIATIQKKVGAAHIVTNGLKDLKAVEDAYVKMVRQAKLMDARPDMGEVKFSIKIDKSGPYAAMRTKDGIFKGAQEKDFVRIARDYLNSKFKGTNIEFGKNDLVFIGGRSVREYLYPAKAPDPGKYSAKMKAAEILNDIFKIAKYSHSAKDDGRHAIAKFGWDYYTARFKIDDEMFEGLINIANGENSRMFYDITKINRLPKSGTKTATKLAANKSTSLGKPINNSIKHPFGGVNPKTSAKVGQESGPNRMEAARRINESDPKTKEQYGENAKEIEDVTIDDTGAWYFAMDIRGFGVRRSKNLRNNADAAFKTSAEGRKWFRDTVETPLYNGKEKYAAEVQKQTDTLYNEVVKKLGIWKGSKESAAVQQLGEGTKKVKEGGQWKLVEYTLDDLKAEFNYTMKNGRKAWENIVEADKVMRKMYDGYIDRVNDSLKKIYPNVEEKVKDIYRRAAKAKMAEGDRVYSISRGNQGVVQKVDGDKITVHFKNQETGLEATVTMDRAGLMLERHSIELMDATRGKRLFPRKDYYRHFRELNNGQFWVGIDTILNSATNIDPRLLLVSQTTQPNSRFAGFLQRRRNGLDYKEDAIGGMLEYIPQAEYKINIEPVIPVMRKTIKELQEATIESRNANKFIENLMEVTNDLAGKTNPIDRIPLNFLGDETGRKLLNGLSKVSNRVRANAVMGNMNSIIAQFFNFPNVVALAMHNAPGTGGKGIAEGMKDSLRAYAGNRQAQEILNKSAFLRERYIDRTAFRRFDKSIAGNSDKFFAWSMELGDKMVADGAFLTFYRQNLAKGMDEAAAIRRADELTMDAVAGRGIAEMPLTQKAKLTKIFAPFQVEVRNTINLIAKLGLSKDPYSLAGVLVGMPVASFFMNMPLEHFFGRNIGIDVIGVIKEAIEDEDAKSIPYRLAGNIAMNYPGGSYLTAAIKSSLGLTDSAMAKLTGGEDASRLGTGSLAVQTFAEPLGKAVSQSLNDEDFDSNIDLIKPIAALLPRYGGKQLERGIRGLQDMAILPREKINLNSGITLQKGNLPASYTPTGKMRFPIEPTPANYLMTPAFGTWSTKEGKEYIRNEMKPLGHKDTAIVETSRNPSLDYSKITFDNGMKSSQKEIDKIKKNALLNDTQKGKKIVAELRNQIKVVKAASHLTEQQKNSQILKIQGEIKKYTR